MVELPALCSHVHVSAKFVKYFLFVFAVLGIESSALHQAISQPFFVFYFATRSHKVPQAGLELAILLPQLPKGRDYIFEESLGRKVEAFRKMLM